MPGRRKVAAVALSDERELIVKIEQVVADRRRRQQDDFLPHPITARGRHWLPIARSRFPKR